MPSSTDGQKEPAFEKDAELHHQPTSWPGARPAACLGASDRGDKVSTLDLTGHGKFTVLTGIGGQGWVDAAKAVAKELGVDIAGHLIGPRQPWQDFSGDWARSREIRDSGVLLVRPDQHVGCARMRSAATRRRICAKP